MIELHHVVDGEPGRPSIVLSGSLGSTLAMWEPQLPALNEHARVIRYDQPGHGASPQPPRGASVDDFAEAVLALLDSLEIERASFCGLSLGGLVGIALASRAPERIERLVLCCTAARIGTAATWAERIQSVRRGGMSAVADAVVARWFTPPFAADHPEVVRRHRAMVAATNAEGYARCCEAIAAADLHERLPDVTVPTLVVSGSEDPVISRDDAETLERVIAGARGVVLSPASHLPNVEQAEAFNRALIAHVTADIAA